MLSDGRRVMVIAGIPLSLHVELKRACPGAYPWKSGKGAFCSPHALRYLEQELRARAIDVRVKDRPKLYEVPSEHFIREQLKRPEFKPVVSELVTPYQVEGLRNFSQLSGAFHWPPGCLSGESELIINRSGNAARIKLADLYHKFNGGLSNKRAWGTSIITFAQSCIDGVIRLNPIEGVAASGVKEVFRVETEHGYQIKTTNDHVYFTPDGERPLSELAVGDLVLVAEDPSNRIATWAKQGKQVYDQQGHMWNHPFHGKKCNGRKYWEARVAMHRLVAEARLNGLTLAEFVGRILLNRLDGLTFLDPAVYAVHHKDRNVKNNAPENLEVVEHREHAAGHGQGSLAHCLAQAVPVKIISIESCGFEETYDVQMQAPHNNFVADGFVVHNSGKALAALSWSILSTTRPVVFVTRAAARWQTAGEVARYTTLDCAVLGGNPPPAWGNPPKPVGFQSAQMVLPSDKLLWASLPSGAQSWRQATVAGIGRALQELEGIAVATGIAGRTFRAAEVTEAKYIGSRQWKLNFAPVVAVPLPRFLICSWELLPAWIDVFEKLDLGAVVYDEIHRGASHKRRKKVAACAGEEGAVELESGEICRFVGRENQTAAAERLSKRAPVRLGTTATPIQNRVRDLWAQLDLVHPAEWGSYSAWAARYCAARPGAYGGLEDKGSSHERELTERLAAVRHLVSVKTTHGELPAKRREVIRLPPEQLCEPDDEIKELLRKRSWAPGGELSAKLLDAAARKHTYIIEELVAALEAGQKVVVLTGRRIDCEVLYKGAKKALGRSYEGGLWMGHGGQSGQAREAMRAAYMAADRQAAVIGTLAAWGESLNLHRTDRAICAMLPFTPGAVEQMEFRFSRLGQDRPVVISYLVAMGTADEHVAGLLLDKLPAVERVAQTDALGGFEDVLGMTDDESINALLKAMGIDVADLHVEEI